LTDIKFKTFLKKNDTGSETASDYLVCLTIVILD